MYYHSVLFCETSEKQEAEICSPDQGGFSYRRARGPEGTYSILHKWHHTANALRHPPELIQRRITASQIRRTASSSCPEHTESCQHERHSSASQLEGSFVRHSVMLLHQKQSLQSTSENVTFDDINSACYVIRQCMTKCMFHFLIGK